MDHCTHQNTGKVFFEMGNNATETCNITQYKPQFSYLRMYSQFIDALSEEAYDIDLQFVRAELGKTRLEVSVTCFTLTAQNLSRGSEENH
jgi:hypothetical protein